ncbi:MAG: ABC transporter permease, partial [bacterium]
MFLLSLLVFFMSRLAPGDPLLSYYGESVERMSMEEQNKAREKLGLNAPLYQQYTAWLKKAVQNDYGISYKYKQPVTKVIGEVYMNTIILGGLAYILTFVFALLLGIFCTLYEDHWLDRIICKLGVITTCIPSFWIALVLILVFSVNLEWLPTSGAYALGQANNIVSRISHLILPLIILTLSHTWYYAYMIRNKLLDEVREDYVLLCKVKGLNKSEIIRHHCLRNIMPAYITIMAIS